MSDDALCFEIAKEMIDADSPDFGTVWPWPEGVNEQWAIDARNKAIAVARLALNAIRKLGVDDLAASRRESAALGAMVARLRDALVMTRANITNEICVREWAERGTNQWPEVARAIDAALALTPATVGATIRRDWTLDEIVTYCRRSNYYGDGQPSDAPSFTRLANAIMVLSDRAPGKDESK